MLEKVGDRARHRMGSSECLREETIKPCVRIKRERGALFISEGAGPHHTDEIDIDAHTQEHTQFFATTLRSFQAGAQIAVCGDEKIVCVTVGQ